MPEQNNMKESLIRLSEWMMTMEWMERHKTMAMQLNLYELFYKLQWNYTYIAVQTQSRVLEYFMEIVWQWITTLIPGEEKASASVREKERKSVAFKHLNFKRKIHSIRFFLEHTT